MSNQRQGVALLPSQAFSVPQTYRDLVSTKFGVSIEGLTFTDPPEAKRALNRWAQTQAGPMVQEVVSSLDSHTQLLLATVASYQGRWSHLAQTRPRPPTSCSAQPIMFSGVTNSLHLLPPLPPLSPYVSPASFTEPFNTSNTQQERFFVSNYQVVVVPMMLRTDKYYLAYDRLLKAGVLKLPMTDGSAMLVVLPDEGVDLGDLEDQVKGEKIRTWIKQLRKT